METATLDAIITDLSHRTFAHVRDLVEVGQRAHMREVRLFVPTGVPVGHQLPDEVKVTFLNVLIRRFGAHEFVSDVLLEESTCNKRSGLDIIVLTQLRFP